MLVVGGQLSTVLKCFPDGLMRIFNLNTLEFQDNYDPTVWSKYKVPDVVTDKIGGE